MKAKLKKIITESRGEIPLRTRMGLSQAEFAQCLGIKLSSLVMSENNHRSLSSSAVLKMGQLEIKLTASAKNLQGQRLMPLPAEKAHSLKSKQFYSSLIRKESRIQQQAVMLTKKLGGMKIKYDHARIWLQTISNEMQDESLRANEAENNWWKNQQVIAIEKLEKYGSAAQSIVQNKISLLESQVSLYKKTQQEFLEAVPGLEPEDIATAG